MRLAGQRMSWWTLKSKVRVLRTRISSSRISFNGIFSIVSLSFSSFKTFVFRWDFSLFHFFNKYCFSLLVYTKRNRCLTLTPTGDGLALSAWYWLGYLFNLICFLTLHGSSLRIFLSAMIIELYLKHKSFRKSAKITNINVTQLLITNYKSY